MFCNKCGVQLNDEASFCHICGNKIANQNNNLEFFSECIETVSIESFSDAEENNVTVPLESVFDSDRNKLPENKDVSSTDNTTEASKNHSNGNNFNTTEIPPLGNIANPVANNSTLTPNVAPAKTSGNTNKKALILVGIIAIVLAIFIGIGVLIVTFIGVSSNSSSSSSSSSSGSSSNYGSSYYNSSYDSNYTSDETIEEFAALALYNELTDHFSYTDLYDIDETRYTVSSITDSGSYWIVRGTFTMYYDSSTMSSTYYNEAFVATIDKDTYSTTCTTSL